MLKKKKQEYEASGEVNRIIPLKVGYAYITDLKGKLHHLKRDSEEFDTLVKEIDEALNNKASREIESLTQRGLWGGTDE